MFRYLETEQIGAVVREQEKKAAWKTAQLQHIRENEEKKRQRNLQVEKMKSEMLNLQIQLHSMNSAVGCGDMSPGSEGLRRRTTFNIGKDAGKLDFEEGMPATQGINTYEDVVHPSEPNESPTSARTESPWAGAFTKHFMGSILSAVKDTFLIIQLQTNRLRVNKQFITCEQKKVPLTLSYSRTYIASPMSNFTHCHKHET